MIRRPPRSTQSRSSAASDVYKRQAYLKTRFGAHEVIVTIMLNFIVLALLNWFIAGHLHVPETLHTPEIHAGVLPRLADIDPRFHGSAANLALIVAVLVAFAVWFYLFRARGGYELRAVGLQPSAAEYGLSLIH